VGAREFSPVPVHRRSGLPVPLQAVIPVVHTLYDYDERFLEK
jgi:hypothetical protein